MAGQSDDVNSGPIDTLTHDGVIGFTNQAQPQKDAREDDDSSLWPIFPDDISIEILSRIPVKDVRQFRFVRKSWKSLTSDPYFIGKHLGESTQHPTFANYRLLLRPKDYCKTCPLNSIFENPKNMAFDVSFPMEYTSDIVMGSCNGLVCSVAYGTERVMICNPTTRLRSKMWPMAANESEEQDDLETFISYGFGCDHQNDKRGFGYGHQNDKYKVVKVFCNPVAVKHSEKTVVKIYTVGSDSWRQIKCFPFPYIPLICNHYGRFVPGTGTLNWLAGRPPDSYCGPLWWIGNRPVNELAIVSLDLKKETYGEVPLPDLDVEELNFEKPMLGSLRDCLCFFYNNGGTHYDMWMMKEYGVKESWTRLITISYLDIGQDGLFRFIEPLFMSQNGEFLMISKPQEQLVLYNRRDNTIIYPKISNWRSVMTCVESLVSPKLPNNSRLLENPW